MKHAAHFPEPVPIDAYGNGGFRFAEMSHKGSLLILPNGMYRWDVGDFSHVQLPDFDAVFEESETIEFLLFGTGKTQHFPNHHMRECFNKAGIGLEPMDTGAAARTFNLLLSEQRAVAAALIAVE